MTRALNRTGPWLVVLMALGATATVAAAYGLRIRGIVIFDETLNVTGGRYLAQHFPSSLFGASPVFTRGPERLTSLLFAAGNQLSSHTATQIESAHILLAVAYAGAAVPTYAIARLSGLGRWWAAGAAALAVCTPLLVFGATLLNTSLSFLSAAVAELAFLWCLLRPRWYTDAASILAVGLMATARVSYGGLGGALLIAIAFQACRDKPGPAAIRRLVRDHWCLVAVSAAAVWYLHTHGVGQASGYVNVSDAPNLTAIWEHLRSSAGQLSVAYALAPFAIAVAWMARTLVRPPDRSSGAFTALAFATWLMLAYINQTGDFEGRYLVALLPLAAVAVVAPLARRELRWWACGVAGLLVARVVALTEAGPNLSGFAHFSATTETWFADVWLGRARIYLPVTNSNVLTVVTVGAAVLAVAVALVARAAPRVWPILGGAMIAATASLGFAGAAYSAGKLTASLPGLSTANPSLRSSSFSQASFIDENIHGDAGILDYTADEAGIPQQWQSVEMFNRRISSTIRIEGQSSGFTCCMNTGPLLVLSMNQSTGAVTVTGGSFPSYIVRVPDWTPGGLAAHLVVTSPVTEPPVSVERPSLPLHAAWTAPEVPPNGWGVPGHALRLRVFPVALSGLEHPCLDVTFTAPPNPPTGNLRIHAGSVRLAVAPGASAPAQVPLAPHADHEQELSIGTSRAGIGPTGAPATVGLSAVAVTQCDPQQPR